MSRPPAIPDIAAETAQGGASLARNLGEARTPKLDKTALIALLDEIEICRDILEAARN
jgi:hypothetical protein